MLHDLDLFDFKRNLFKIPDQSFQLGCTLENLFAAALEEIVGPLVSWKKSHRHTSDVLAGR